MVASDVVKGIGGLISTATLVILLIFGNFLLGRASAPLFGAYIPTQTIHVALGPILVVLNSAVLVYISALYRMELSDKEITALKGQAIRIVLAPLMNPFYVGRNRVITAIGYAFLIILWWLGLHSFLYSLNFGRSSQSPWLFGWQVMIFAIYVALGLASLLMIQSCWVRFGFDSYRLKWICGFIGIPIGAFLPPIILQLGLPSWPFRWSA